ncbi:SGNH/GDSL hydrolase family protein [uncultured Bacteroides sp.]|uniref:SGNH/GDSL hydrolase family protein n=1 Tax=uncultured Bacteroides sp. TaxID=162156 RepID=UPI0025EFCA97|nr:SGNH/GDSL hydrolase family protein [uncultured Bacteroides sp.]
MKKLVCMMLCLWVGIGAFAQKEGKYSTYYYQRASLFEVLPVDSDDILFVGNSITDGGEWCELFQNPNVKNRGISGDTTQGVYDRLDALLKGTPAQIFLLIGINNVPRGESADSIAAGIRRIVQRIRQESPATEVLVQSVLPVTPQYGKFDGHTSRWQLVPEINRRVRRLAQEEKVTYIDLFSHFADAEGKMKPEYTNDGLHLKGNGYLLWKEMVQPFLKK